MSGRIRPSKEAVPTQSLLVMRGILIGFLGIVHGALPTGRPKHLTRGIRGRQMARAVGC